jgi:hypothetical protein
MPKTTTEDIVNIYAKADQWLIGTVFEPSAWWCQYRYEFGHPQLARASYLVAFVVANCIAPMIAGDIIGLLFGMAFVAYFLILYCKVGLVKTG